MASGYISPDTSELVIVYVNWSPILKSVIHSLNNLSGGNTVASMIPYITNSYNNLTRQETASGRETFTIPARSVVTMVMSLNYDNLLYTGIDEYRYQDSYRIFPNPTNGAFTISNMGSTIENNVNFLLFGATGNLIFSDKMDGDQYVCNALKGKQNGLYFIKIGNHFEKISKVQ